MPNYPQGVCFFPGVDRVISGTMSVVRGISPSVCVMVMSPQSSLSGNPGTLVFSYGGGSVEWPDAKPDYASLSVGADGWSWTVNIMDRRWKWRFGKISGRYNVWRDNFTLQDGKPDPEADSVSDTHIDTVRTPQELAKLCLKEMGEDNYDVTALPNDSRPPVDWDGDNPAGALADLCESLGCDLVLGQRNNKVVVVRTGVGADLPSDGVMTPGFTLDAPEMPDKIGVLCGPTRFQVDFELEPVAMDAPTGATGAPKPQDDITVSGPLIRRITSDKLSYAIVPGAPTAGFTYGDVLNGFLNVANDGVTPSGVSGLRELALRSVLRFYRIKTPVDVPGYGTVNLEQLMLEDEQVTQWFVNYEKKNLPYYVYGIYFDPDMTAYANNVTGDLKPAPIFAKPVPTGTRDVFYMRDSQFDTAHGIVIFRDPVVKNSDPAAVSLTIEPAELRLRCACTIRDSKTQEIVRYTRERDTGAGLGTKTQWLRHDEIVQTHIPKYGDSFDADGTKTNLEFGPEGTASGGVDAQCDYYIDAAIDAYQLTASAEIQYGGLRLIELDGAIQHVVYSVGTPTGAVTMASRGSEMKKYVLPYKERRRIEKLPKVAKDLVQERAKGRASERKSRMGRI